MRQVTRFFLARDLSQERRDILIKLFVDVEHAARRHRGRDVVDARRAAETYRSMIAAFCAPAARVLNHDTLEFEQRRTGGL
jgi:hypothetical protein